MIELLQELQQFGYRRIEQLEEALRVGFDALIEYEKVYPPTDIATQIPCQYSSVGVIRGSLELTDDKYLSDTKATEYSKDKIRQFRKYLKKK